MELLLCCCCCCTAAAHDHVACACSKSIYRVGEEGEGDYMVVGDQRFMATTVLLCVFFSIATTSNLPPHTQNIQLIDDIMIPVRTKMVPVHTNMTCAPIGWIPLSLYGQHMSYPHLSPSCVPPHSLCLSSDNKPHSNTIAVSGTSFIGRELQLLPTPALFTRLSPQVTHHRREEERQD